MLIMLSMLSIYGYRDWTNAGFYPPSTAHYPRPVKEFFRPAHWARPAKHNTFVLALQ